MAQLRSQCLEAGDGRRAGIEQSLGGNGAGRHSDGRHGRRAGGEHVPRRVTHTPAALGRDGQAICGPQQQVGRRFGVLNLAAVDDHRRPRQAERIDRRLHLLGPAGGRDGPRPVARLERKQQLTSAGQRAWPVVQPAVDLACPPVDRLRPLVLQLAPGDRRDFARQPLSVGADQARDVLAVGRQADLREGFEPGPDARLDGLDEGPVKVKDEPVWLGQLA